MPNMEDFLTELNQKIAFADRLEGYLKDVARIGSININYTSTKEYLGNHGYAEGNDSYTVSIRPNGNNTDNLDLNIGFEELKEMYAKLLENELIKLRQEIDGMKAKKEKAEKLLIE